jgi:hypothetical protein
MQEAAAVMWENLTHWTAPATASEAHGARKDISGTSVTYTETGIVGVGKDGIESWLQYALRTVAAEDWSSLAVDPQLALTALEIAVDIDARFWFLVQTHD